MILKALLLLALAFALYWTFITKKILPAIITLGMIVGVLLTLFLSKTVENRGIYVYMGFVALAFLYSFLAKDTKIGSRIIIALMSASIFTYWLCVVNHWHGNEMLAPILVLLVGLAAIIGKANLKKELGFLTILAVDAILIIIEHLLKAN
jgi:hypothetical protein